MSTDAMVVSSQRSSSTTRDRLRRRRRSLEADHPLGDAIETFIRREDAECFIEEIRADEPKLAKPLRIEKRELEVGERNLPCDGTDMPACLIAVGYAVLGLPRYKAARVGRDRCVVRNWRTSPSCVTSTCASIRSRSRFLVGSILAQRSRERVLSRERV